MDVKRSTRPPLFSTHIAFFLCSMHKDPAIVGLIVEGGTCRKPGPNFKEVKGLAGIGRRSGEMFSPGKTPIDVCTISM